MTARARQLMPPHIARLFFGPDGKRLEVPLVKTPTTPPPPPKY